MVGVIFWAVDVCFMYKYLCTGTDAKGTVTVSWFSGFESLSYNREDDATEATRRHLENLVSDLTCVMLIAREESLYACPLSPILC